MSKYLGSELQISIENCNDVESLTNKLRYVQMAIKFHKEQSNKKEKRFFKKAEKHTEVKLLKLNKEVSNVN